MTKAEIRALARSIYGAGRVRASEMRSWLVDGRMSDSQRLRLGGDRRPACFAEDAQWFAWCIHEAARPVIGVSSYCADCTLAFKVRMCGEGRCTYPLTIFSRRRHNTAVVGRRARADSGRASPPRR